MSNSRLQVLRQALDQHADDPFTRYLVALEYVKVNQPEEAFAEFQTLVERHPEYVPTYYQYAMALEKEGRVDAARRIFQLGIAAATKAGDGHAKSELMQALEAMDD